MREITFKHSGSIGDAFASLPAIREFCRMKNRKVTLLLEAGVVAAFPEGTTHPTRNNDDVMVLLNEKVIEMMIPLLKAQPYLEDVRLMKEDDKIDIDLDCMRDKFVNMPYTCLSRVYFLTFPDLACDLSEQWLTVPDAEKDIAKNKVIITRTERYTNEKIDYLFLKEFEDDLIFSGTMREYNNFCMNYDLEIPKLHIENFLDLAQAIKQSRFHISNQTMAFQISQGLKHPRILELCHYAPNVIPIGKNAYDFYEQMPLEYYFHKLYGKEQEFVEKIKASPKAIIDDAV